MQLDFVFCFYDAALPEKRSYGQMSVQCLASSGDVRELI